MKRNVSSKILIVILSICTVFCVGAACKETATGRIIFKTFTVAGTNVYGAVDYDVSNFFFPQEILPIGNVEYSIFTDSEGLQPLSSKTTKLNVGNNYFYVKVIADNKTTIYSLVIYRADSFKVFFDTGETILETIAVSEGDYVTSPSETPSRIGYTFSGWDYDFSQPITKDTRINAIWTAKQYTVTYNANGGTVSKTSDTVTYQKHFSFPVATFDEHQLVGWFYNGEPIYAGPWTIDSDAELVAEWTENKYSIEYVLAGGSTTNRTEYTAQTETFTLNAPVNPGYVFLGWTYAGQTTPVKTVTIEKGSSGNKKYTANWAEIFVIENNVITGFTELGKDVEDIIIPSRVGNKSITGIAESAFQGQTNIKRLEITNTNLIILPAFIFKDCTALEHVDLSRSSIRRFGNDLFKGCTSLKTVFLPYNFQSLAEGAFSGCSSLSTIYINSDCYIYSSAFQGCTSLANVYFFATINAWANVLAEEGWNDDIPASIVHCSDGDVDITATFG